MRVDLHYVELVGCVGGETTEDINLQLALLRVGRNVLQHLQREREERRGWRGRKKRLVRKERQGQREGLP